MNHSTIIRYWNVDVDENKVECRYWNSSFLGHGTYQDLLTHFEADLEVIDVTKLVQVSMDGPSVNWCSLDLLQKRCTERELPALADIVSCNLHVVNGAFKTGAEATDWEIKKTLKGHFICYMILLHAKKTSQD